MCHSFASLKDRSEFAVGKRAFSPELAVALADIAESNTAVTEKRHLRMRITGCLLRRLGQRKDPVVKDRSPGLLLIR